MLEKISVGIAASPGAASEAVSRKPYCAMTVNPIELISNGRILAGSETDMTIAPNNVEVQEFSPGFDDGNGGEIGFEVEF